jgi:predicted permease
MKIALSPARYDTDEKRATFYAELVKRVESLPGIRSAAVTLTLPMTGFVASTVQLPGKPVAKAGDRPISIIQSVTPEYFSTLKIALVRGREFNAHDNAGAIPVVIINEKLAHLLWTQYPNGLDPIGQYLLIGSNPRPKQIIGISSDVRQAAKNEDPRPGLYIPSAQKPSQSAMLAVRTDRDPLLFANAVHNEVFAIDHDQPISEVLTMDELVEASQGQLRLMMRLLGLFAGIATLFAVVGLYGIVSYSVVQRTREIGIRRALGAQPMNIILLVVKQGIVLSVVGILLGTCAALALTRVMSNLLFEVSATDTWTFLGVAILFLFVGLTASYIPARRAIRMNPSTALRVG